MTEEKPDSPLTALCKKFEHFETARWAAKEIFNHEILTRKVLDVGAGTGILTRASGAAGYDTYSLDVHDWGHIEPDFLDDFLTDKPSQFQSLFLEKEPVSIITNPPFSLAEPFVERAKEIGARKILCFQRFSWWESEGRDEFWSKYPPNRIYVCGSRATCWRHDIPPEDRVDAKGNPKTTPTAHAWFVWEKGHPTGTIVGRIYDTEKINHKQKGKL